MSCYKEKTARHPKRQKTPLEEAEQTSESDVGRDVGIIIQGIF